MKRPLISLFIILGLISGCAYFQKKDEPPPLPEIVETKPPLSMKGAYFNAYPWGDLATRKDGNDPDTTTYTFEDGDTLDSVAEKEMGDAGLASDLAKYNEISPSSKVTAGDKIVIPNPIIGVSSQIIVKSKGEKEFGAAQSFDTKFKKGDEYKLRFEPNVDGYCYIFRETPKGVEMLYPAQIKVPPTKAQSRAQLKSKKAKTPAKASLMRDTAKVKAHRPIEIPVGKKGFVYDAKDKGDRVFVFLSLRENLELENLKDKPNLKIDDVEKAMHQVKVGADYSEGQYRLLRIKNVADLLGFVLNISG